MEADLTLALAAAAGFLVFVVIVGVFTHFLNK
jgi:hypothetical protein